MPARSTIIERAASLQQSLSPAENTTCPSTPPPRSLDPLFLSYSFLNSPRWSTQPRGRRLRPFRSCARTLGLARAKSGMPATGKSCSPSSRCARSLRVPLLSLSLALEDVTVTIFPFLTISLSTDGKCVSSCATDTATEEANERKRVWVFSPSLSAFLTTNHSPQYPPNTRTHAHTHTHTRTHYSFPFPKRRTRKGAVARRRVPLLCPVCLPTHSFACLACLPHTRFCSLAPGPLTLSLHSVSLSYGRAFLLVKPESMSSAPQPSRNAAWLTPPRLPHARASAQYVKTNKANDNDWFRLESNKEGTRYAPWSNVASPPRRLADAGR